MSTHTPYLSIRWKIILLAATVLGLTSALFIWQQHKLQLHELELNQAEFREHSGIILNHLFQSQAYRMQMLGNLLIEASNARSNILRKRGDRLTQAVQDIAPELNFAQGLVTVVFHDANQKPVAIWGDPLYADGIAPLAGLSIAHEKPNIHLFCKQSCVQQIAIPLEQHGRNIGSVTLISNLDRIQSDLNRLNKSEVAVLYGNSQNEHMPIQGMRLVSIRGEAAVRDILEASRNIQWQDGMIQLEHTGQMYQVVLISMQPTDANRIRFAFIQNITSKLQSIDSKVQTKFMWGLFVLGFAMLLLYLMLRPTMRRFAHLNQILPLLGKEDFAQVRVAYAQRPVGKWLGGIWQDEVDDLESMALAMAEHLELLREESLHHLDKLSLQTRHLKQERDFISSLLDTAPVLILTYDKTGCIQLCNAHALKACGLRNVNGKNFAELFMGVSQQEYDREISELASGNMHRMESSKIKADDSLCDILWFHSRLSGTDANKPIFLSVGMDITEHKKNEARIHHLAFYDPISKLPNRRMLMDCMRHAMISSGEENIHCAIIFIDLDNFKTVNDSKGRDTGDLLLIGMAKRLRSNVRGFDTVAHLGGDEFVVLLEELDENLEHAAAQARLITEKLRSTLAQPYLIQDYTYHFTSSVGITLFSDHENTPEVLLRQANIAMTHAKTSGRDNLHFFDPAMQHALQAKTTLEADLRTALSQNQFHLYYQVQANYEGKALGAEALVRWQHPEQGMISPAQFIPFAEESVLMLPLGQWLLETACAQIKAWEADSLTHTLQLAVNVSARQFHHDDFVVQVKNILASSGANPARLKIELTESTVLEDIADAVAKMHQLKDIGVQFSIDDFGTAYSSLSYLTQLPLDQLKIDQSFVRNIGVKPSDDIVVKTIITMANDLGMDVIAEGVETQAQRQFLKEAGCSAYQGYLFSKPLALEDFMEMLCKLREEGR